MTSTADGPDTFVYALKTNLSQLIQFCSSLQHKINRRHIISKHYQRHTSSQMFENNSIIR